MYKCYSYIIHLPLYIVKVEILSDIILGGAGLGLHFKVAQLHFHWGNLDSQGSEHNRNGKEYSMEVIYSYYVYSYNSDYNIR